MNDLSRQSRFDPGATLRRVSLVHVLSALSSRSLAVVARERFGDDEGVTAVVRATTGTADTATAGWAAELVRQDVQAFVTSLAPVSVYAGLVGRGLAVEFDAAGSVRVPFDAGDGTEVSGEWIGESGVIPAKRGALGAATLARYKLGVISVFTEELLRATPANAEAFVQRMTVKHTAQALDGYFLSAAPGVAGLNPPGIVNGVAPIAASAAGTAAERALADLSAIVSAIVAAGNGERIVIVVNTAQRTALAMMRVGDQWLFRDEMARGQLMGVEFVTSRFVPVGNVYALDCENLVTGLGVPEIDANREAAFVDANGVMSSAFQQWCAALRNVLPISWATTRAGSVAWVEGVTW